MQTSTLEKQWRKRLARRLKGYRRAYKRNPDAQMLVAVKREIKRAVEMNLIQPREY